ncbi:MAG: phosphatidate cytidylyltransferase [Syntrophales bacterium]|jgi:phosphatidate cytidylyltransferase
MEASHAKRWITGIIVVPLLFALIYFGPAIMFNLLIVLVVLLATWEYQAMAFGDGHNAEKIQGFVIAFLFPLAALLGQENCFPALIAFSIIATFSLYLLKIRDADFDLTPFYRLVFGMLYIPFMMSHFILLRSAPYGVAWVFFVIILAFSGDITAYYTGRKWGRKKLHKYVSPGKTGAGILGLVSSATVACIIYQQIFFPQISPWCAGLLGFAGSTIGQLGDLCESALKRSAGVKDSGGILPGHGGMLDRLDCLIFIGPFIYYCQRFLIS